MKVSGEGEGLQGFLMKMHKYIIQNPEGEGDTFVDLIFYWKYKTKVFFIV